VTNFNNKIWAWLVISLWFFMLQFMVIVAAKGMLHGMNVSSECAGESSLRGIYHLPCTRAILNLVNSISV